MSPTQPTPNPTGPKGVVADPKAAKSFVRRGPANATADKNKDTRKVTVDIATAVAKALAAAKTDTDRTIQDIVEAALREYPPVAANLSRYEKTPPKTDQQAG